MGSMTATAAEVQREIRRRRQAEGQVKKSLWLTPAENEALRARFPGHAGGIRWTDVIRAALAAPSRW